MQSVNHIKMPTSYHEMSTHRRDKKIICTGSGARRLENTQINTLGPSITRLIVPNYKLQFVGNGTQERYG